MTTINVPLLIALAASGFFLLVGLICRYAVGKRGTPCPARFSWILYNPYTRFVAGTGLIVERAGIKPGMKVLDAGCGPGRLTIPAAKAVGPNGLVIAFDVQAEMLGKVEKKITAEGLTNVTTVLGSLGEGLLEDDTFDRAILVTVLGEVPDRAAALAEIYRALKPGGVLSVTEMIPDPDYLTRRTVQRLAERAGFRLDRDFGTWLAFTMNFAKPMSVDDS